MVRLSGGGLGWGRVFGAASPRVGDGTLLAAFEVNHNDGPWELPDDYRKLNGVLRYHRGDSRNVFSITGMGYRGEWNSTDQVPLRAIEEGLIPRFGNIDSSDGGNTHRYSVSADGQRSNVNSLTRASAFFLHYDLSLFSNFTYFLDNPDDGDQFEQADRRAVSGARVIHRRLGRLGRFATENAVGVQLRHDAISTVGLYKTKARERMSTTREDEVGQTSLGLFAQSEIQWAPRVRTLLGLRGDSYWFDVQSDNPLNSGTDTDGLLSPKALAVIGPWNGTELYVSGGFGFHSNDARGATITVDPDTGDPAERVTPLVRTRGAELGVRSVRIPGLQTTVTVWWLGLDSELIFVGDAGTTEPGRPSRRYGLEWSNYARVGPWMTVDLDLSLSRGRFADTNPASGYIPGAVTRVLSGGISVDSVPEPLWEPAPSQFRAARAHRRQQRAFKRNDAGQWRDWLSADGQGAAVCRCLQHFRQRGQRHRLLLFLPAATRASRWGRWDPHPSHAAPHRPSDISGRFLNGGAADL